jgi:hypothetical protein
MDDFKGFGLPNNWKQNITYDAACTIGGMEGEKSGEKYRENRQTQYSGEKIRGIITI